MDNDTYIDVTMHNFNKGSDDKTTSFVMRSMYFCTFLLALFFVSSLIYAYYLSIKEKIEERKRERRRREERRRQLEEQTYEEFNAPASEQDQETTETSASSQFASGDKETTSVAGSHHCDNTIPLQGSLEEKASLDSISLGEHSVESAIPQQEKLKREAYLASPTFIDYKPFYDHLSKSTGSSLRSSCTFQPFRKSVDLLKMQKMIDDLGERNLFRDLTASEMPKQFTFQKNMKTSCPSEFSGQLSRTDDEGYDKFLKDEVRLRKTPKWTGQKEKTDKSSHECKYEVSLENFLNTLASRNSSFLSSLPRNCLRPVR